MAAQREQAVRVARGMLKHMVAPLISQMGLNKETAEPVALLDNACGSGVLTQEVQAALEQDVLQKSSFTCADVAPNMVDLVKWRVENEGWINTEVKNLDAMNTQLPAKSFSHIGISMGVHLIPDPNAVLADCKRTLRRGGILGLSAPDQDGSFWESDIRSSFASFPFPAPIPDYLPKQMHEQGKWTDLGWIKQHLESEGFSDVKVTIGRRKHRVESAGDFVETFGPMLAWFLTKWWDEETRAAHPAEEVLELVKKHLTGKYEGEGWDMEWSLIYATARWEDGSD